VFTPKWKKEGMMTLKAGKRFLNYKRDLLTLNKIGEIQSRQEDLQKAIKAKDKAAVAEAIKQLNYTCEKSLTAYRPAGAIADNIEGLWVPIVIALGIRAYFVQPFKIPTGSMQPALNGIIAKSEDGDWEKPGLGTRIFQNVMKGRSYYDLVADKNKSIVAIEDRTKFIFSRTCIRFDDGSDVVISCPPAEAMGIETIKKHLRHGGKFSSGVHFKKGDPIFRGTLTTGDLVLVDKISYHFRQPKRGESFVFNTRGLQTSGGTSGMSSQQNATHYIKRLVAVPNDELQIKTPDLWINGALAKEETIRRVARREKISEDEMFSGYTHADVRSRDRRLLRPGATTTMLSPDDRNQREFFAMGDNSPNSLDSRYWGPVKQYNLVGPALFALWPFTSGHWGVIE
jgi:signal peptidase I